MNLIKLIFWSVLLPTALWAHGDPVEDNSKAGIDGPYVFYRGGKITVKSVVKKDTGMTASNKVYDNARNLVLRCLVPETRDAFGFTLQDSLTVQPDRYAMPEKMLVLSDIEGNFKGFKMMLQGAGVIDPNLNWTFGAGHLVLLGDFVDRGLNVTECLWLVYKLETEAIAAGGRVHFILGNHEVLNMQGNTQYVRKKYLENCKVIGEDFSQLYGVSSEIGRWLRTKHAVIQIGDYLFCHGGISPEIASSGLTISEINSLSRQHLGKKQENIISVKAQTIFDQKYGVFWFRNAAKNMMTTDVVKSILDQFGAKRMVVGHTLQNDLVALYGGKVICIDLYHEENMRQGFMKTLLIENGACFGLDSKGEKFSVFNVSFPNK